MSIRKIQTQEEMDRKAQRNKTLVGVIMVLLIVVSSAGYAIMSREDSSGGNEKVKYGNLIFAKINGYWQTSFNNKILFFNSLPKDLENVTINGTIAIDNYYGKNVYIVNSNQAVVNLAAALEGVALKVQEACIDETECITKNLPLKDCTENLIVYLPADETSVEKVDNCVYLKGNFFEASDKLLYRLFGIA